MHEKIKNSEQWSTIIDQMLSKGADLNDDEVEIVVDYLSKNFGAAKDPRSGRKTSEPEQAVNARDQASPVD